MKLRASHDCRLLFLGYAIPDELFQKITKTDKFPQIQGSKLIWKIIRGIEESSEMCLDLISAVPASDYPDNSRIFFRFSKWKHQDSANDIIMPYVNIIIIKHITRFISSLLLVSSWLVKNRHIKNRHILIYAMHSPFMFASVLSSLLFGGKVTLIIPDLPAFMDLGVHRNIILRMAKKIDAFIMNKMLHRMAGIIALTKHMAKDISHLALPSIIMEGSVYKTLQHKQPSQDDFQHSSEDKIIMYTGALAGLELLLDAFSLIPDQSYYLWICGRGEMKNVIMNAAVRDKRIIYWGLLSEDDLKQKCSQATIFVNPLSSKTPYIQYSFPSKLLEYMVTGRPVITTNLPGIPEDYHEYLFILDDETPLGLAKLIKNICSKSPQELLAFGYAAQEFVRTKKNYLQQGKRLYEFIISL